MKNILTKIINGICIVIIIISLILLACFFFGKTDNGILGYYPYRVLTGSMEPNIPTDSFILVKHVDDVTTLKKGDVITFYSRDPILMGSVNTHRIEDKYNNIQGVPIFITKGDANLIQDAYEVYAEDIVGKVIFHSLIIGKIVRLISNPIVFIPVVAVPLLIILLVNIYGTIKVSREMAQAEEEEALLKALEEVRRRRKELEDKKEEE